MRDTLQQYSQKHSTQFKLWHVLTSPPEGWQVSAALFLQVASR